MVQLPAAFVESTRCLLGDERFERYLRSFEEEPPVSIRLNPLKARDLEPVGGEPVAWCQGGYYLPRRPSFTMDPLLHAGCYYVQEAASMFLDEVLRQLLPDSSPLECLDLCAAPGGKSTLLRAALPADCVLYSNEPIRNRFNILAENVRKWGYENHHVTNLYPKDIRKSRARFDIILCDVPCSGEGMFRKDAATISEWSQQNIDKCAALQRSIISDIWPCLNGGGLLIYSTCTFNIKENEENIRWILSEYDAEAITVETQPAWSITGSLLEGFNEPVYRFIPGVSRGEGLFMCALRKRGKEKGETERREGKERRFLLTSNTSSEPEALPHSPFKSELSYPQALAYLRGEALTLPPDTPRGMVGVTFMGHALGQVKNIGPRANNLYPKPWRIKTTHIPNDYEAILRHT